MATKYPFLYPLDTPIDSGAIAPIREWLKFQKHLPQISDEFIYLFYKKCDQSLEQTKKIIDLHFTMRTLLPELFNNRDPRNHDKSYNNYYISVFDEPNVNGNVVILLKFRDKNYNFDFTDIMKSFIIAMEGVLAKQRTIPNGFCVILDMSTVTLSIIPKVNLSLIRKVYLFIQESLHVKLTGIYLINTPSYIETLMSFVKTFVNQWIIDLLHYHDKPTEFENIILLKSYPNEYGGEKESLHKQTEDFITFLKNEFRILLEKEDHLLKVDEKKRIEKVKSSGEIFGMEGSFKKLEID